MNKRSVWMPLLLICCLVTSSCGPTRGKQVKILKQIIPEVKQFVEDNGEFFRILLEIKEKICEINEQKAEEMGEYLAITLYHIGIYNGNIEFNTYGYDKDLRYQFSPLSNDERICISETMFDVYMSNDRSSVSIKQDEINFSFARSMNTELIIHNPVWEIEDPGEYFGQFQFTIEVNDDWCILFFNST